MNHRTDPDNDPYHWATGDLTTGTGGLTRAVDGVALDIASGVVKQAARQVSAAVDMLGALTTQLARLDEDHRRPAAVATATIGAAAEELRRALSTIEQAGAVLQTFNVDVASGLAAISVTDAMIDALIRGAQPDALDRG